MSRLILDRTDFKIISALNNNCRTSYRSIGNEIGLTAKSVKNRVDKIVSKKIIDRFILNLNLGILGYKNLYVLVIRHNRNSTKNIIDNLNLVGDLIFHVTCLGGISAFGLAMREDLDEKIELLNNALKPGFIQSSFVVKEHVPYSYTLKLIDYKIIQSLLKDPRIEISNLSKEIGISERTITRRLGKMIENHIIEFSLLFNPSVMSGYIIFYMLISFDKSFYHSIIDKIYKELPDYFLDLSLIFNQDDFIVLTLFGESIFNIDSILSQIELYEGIKGTEIFLPTKMEVYEEQIARAVDKKIKEFE